MSLFIAALNSGSNANCYYIGNHTEAVLVDAGLSCRETEKRIKRLGLNLQNIKAIFISHEHADHICGLPVIARKHKIPVYITAATYKNSRLEIDKELLFYFTTNEIISIGTLHIKAFSKYHDAHDPHSFVISHQQTHIGVFTDLGRVCDELIHHFKQCHAVFLESNYDVDMLETGGYPYPLKQRIRNGFGHLSNIEALQLFKQHRTPQLTHLILSHLSKNNNNPELVETLFKQHAGKTNVIVASRYKESEVFHISNNNTTAFTGSARKQTVQLTMF